MYLFVSRSAAFDRTLKGFEKSMGMTHSDQTDLKNMGYFDKYVWER